MFRNKTNKKTYKERRTFRGIKWLAKRPVMSVWYGLSCKNTGFGDDRFFTFYRPKENLICMSLTDWYTDYERLNILPVEVSVELTEDIEEDYKCLDKKMSFYTGFTERSREDLLQKVDTFIFHSDKPAYFVKSYITILLARETIDNVPYISIFYGNKYEELTKDGDEITGTRTRSFPIEETHLKTATFVVNEIVNILTKTAKPNHTYAKKEKN